EQPLEHVLDPAGRPEHALDLRAAAAARDDGEFAPLGAPERFAVEGNRRPRREVRLADDELPPAPDLDDGADGFQARPGGTGAASAPSRRRRAAVRSREGSARSARTASR